MEIPARYVNAIWPVLAVYGIWLIALIIRRKRSNASPSADMPVLLAQTVGGDQELIAGYQDVTPSGMHFTYNLSGMSLFSTETTTGAYSVELPFMSGVHLLGCAKAGNPLVEVNLSGSAMEHVELEGNYSDYFTLYADTEQQVQSRYVLDPTAMVFTMDFCSQFNWEIVEDTLYFMSSGHLPSFAIVDEFVKQIRPAIETASDRRSNPYRMSYNNFAGRTMLCPICQKQLVEGEQWLECPDGHGSLVTGGQLLALRDDAFKDAPVAIDDDGGKATIHGVVKCPYCGSAMTASHYQTTATIIDVCPKCMFRWLDSGELKRLVDV